MVEFNMKGNFMLDNSSKASATRQSAATNIEAEIRDAVGEWVDAINNGNVHTVDALYVPNAVLLATFDPRPRRTPEEREDYFTAFKMRQKLKASIEECTVAVIGDEGGSASGLYSFNFIDHFNTPQTARARFTFVFARQPEGDLQIVAHHSSVIPTAIPVS
jgi:hypothetical protein